MNKVKKKVKSKNDLGQMITPGSKWGSKENTFIHGHQLNKGDAIYIESVQIYVDEAFVFFLVDGYRAMLEAITFRNKFVPYKPKKEQKK